MRLIEVTWHALEQFKIRFPEEAGSRGYIRLLIAREIEEAFEYGRYATKQPRWARSQRRHIRGIRNGYEVDRSMRFAWTENQKRMYLVDKDGVAFRAVTCFRPDGDSMTT